MNQEQNEDIWVKPLFVEGRQLRLEPLALKHLDDLEKNLLSAQSWHFVHWQSRTRADMEKAILRSFQVRKEGLGSSVAMVLRSTGEAVGMSRFMGLNRMHRYLEIGGTWIGDQWQKTFVNTEAKILMLSHAFETIQCQRVEFRVDALNFSSQRGVLRLGAKYEGELRNACLLPDGRKRDYKVYSILDSEWPNIKSTLNWYLEKYV
ncbi:GNAT family N-acetyltransferase [Bdellovibrio sp. HCB337]|uniref:GNAT family N-acetyltransferase n=1 Tax=Bdellovibrio sp. HCB337 TaxID=3394358 RepID=UPI0039A75286